MGRAGRLFFALMLCVAIFASPDIAAAACSWSVIASANPSSNDELSAVSANSPTGAWAVGGFFDAGGALRPLAEHWNGSSWTNASIPAQGWAGGIRDVLTSVSADSSSDAWTVGYADVGAVTSEPMIEHWNGSTWSIVPSPSFSSNFAFLNSVEAFSPTNVWAVGAYTYSGANEKTIIEHWNGVKWRVIPGPNINSVNDALYSISGIGERSLWAVGKYAPDPAHPTVVQTLTVHLIGSTWSVVSSPNITGGINVLNSVAAPFESSAFAAGYSSTGSSGATLAEDWNGSAWSIQPSPTGSGFSGINAIAARRADHVLAVGGQTPSSLEKTFAMKWNGTAWASVPPIDAGSFDDLLSGASAIPGTASFWAVGGFDDSSHSNFQTLIEMFHC